MARKAAIITRVIRLPIGQRAFRIAQSVSCSALILGISNPYFQRFAELPHEAMQDAGAGKPESCDDKFLLNVSLQQPDNSAVICTNIRPACRIGIKTITTKRGRTFIRNACRLMDTNTFGILIISIYTS